MDICKNSVNKVVKKCRGGLLSFSSNLTARVACRWKDIFLEVVKMISRYSDSFTNNSSFHQFLFNIEIRQNKVKLYLGNEKGKV